MWIKTNYPFKFFRLISILILLQCFLIKSINSVNYRPFEDKIIEGKVGVSYKNQQIDSNNRIFFVYQLPVQIFSESNAVRVDAYIGDNPPSNPLLFSIERSQSILSWQLPMALKDLYYYNNVNRTLCPQNGHDHFEKQLIISVSTMSNKSIAFSIFVDIIDINVSNARNILISPSAPKYFLYKFPPEVESVVVKVESEDGLCAVLSVQDTNCPVFDMIGNYEHVKYHSTMTKKGAVTINKALFSQTNSFYIVLVVQPNDMECNKMQKIMPNDGTNYLMKMRLKNFTTIQVTSSISNHQYYFATFIVFAFFFSFYIVSLVICLIYNYNYLRTTQLALKKEEINTEIKELIDEQLVAERSYGTMDTQVVSILPSNNSISRNCNKLAIMEGTSSETFSEEGDIEKIEDYDQIPSSDYIKTNVYVSDLAKPRKVLSKKYRLYVWNLITLAIFYFLPVIQLVLTYQKAVNKSGDQDVCYYNFYCLRPLGVLASFNSIYSNIGYVMLGILFLILVYRRDKQHSYLLLIQDKQTLECGIPQHFGMFYALGIALIMEGLLSGCYHVCPSYNNFQFDTAFMYMIGWLSMLKIYQTRHQDTSAHSHSAYIIISFVVFLGVIGMTEGNQTFWIVLVAIHVISCFLLSIQVYYMGNWNLDMGVFLRLYNRIRYEKFFSSRPLYCDRLILLIIGNLINWAISIYGTIVMPKDFASYLLSIVISNLLMYFFFYIFMKVRSRERLPIPALLYIILACIVWAFAMYFFINKLYTWQVSPAISREHNEDCLLFHFYDNHDIWHFLSAISLFLSFMILLTMDDGLQNVPRNLIKVF